MNLTDNEKRDAIKLIQDGKPLPDKYRFLLFKDDREVELVWNGKTGEVTNTVLPFQTIEHIDEPRSEQKKGSMDSLFDTSGRQIKGWTNKLIWGDNKLVLSSLKNGALRKEIEAQGGLKLIYIDPPFDIGADFAMHIEIGDEQFTKQPSVIEEVAFRDTWGNGADSFIAMIYERLKLMHDLLANDGSIYVHCDWRLNADIRLVMDEIFGSENFRNEITWRRDVAGKGAKKKSQQWPRNSDAILYYTKSDHWHFEQQYLELTKEQQQNYRYVEESTGRRFKTVQLGDYSQKSISEMEKVGLIYVSSTGKKYKKYYLDEAQATLDSIWTDIAGFGTKTASTEHLDYPTQKTEQLLERIIASSSKKGDLVADFFCGSGTTMAVAEKLDRKWIGSDLGRFAIHTARKRMVGVQRELKKSGEDYRAFEILNIGKYERDSLIGMGTTDERSEVRRKVQERKEKEFVKLILAAYKAEPVDSFANFVGKKRDRLVAVGSINSPVSAGLVDDILEECKDKGVTKVDVLGFDYEMGLDFSELKKQGVDIQFRVIPREVFDKQAVEKGQVKFYDVAYVDIKPIVKKNSIAVELTDFSVFYNQDDSGEIVEKLKPGSSRVVIREGKVIKITKDKQSDIVEEEVLTKKWTDWVDYWAVDFNFEDKKEIICKTDPETGKEKEEWTGGYIFENEWQSFRTKRNRTLDMMTPPYEVSRGKRKIAVKVVDIFGNDTTRVIDVTI